MATISNAYLDLPANTNQARGIGQYAIDFCQGRFPGPAGDVLERTDLFHLDSIACAVAALGCRTNAPRILRTEALEYVSPTGAACFASPTKVQPEKAVLANASAVRELDANGTNFGYNPRTGDVCGEFGHNDFYPVVVAAAQQAGLDGSQTVRAMVCLDEIRGRLAEVFSLKDHKIDHVVHGAVASAAVYGAMLGATVDQIESAIGQVVAHFVPFRAIRAGHQLSDSKGASAAISAEVSVVSMRRAMRGFVGPADVFRNPQALFCLFEPPADRLVSPFDLSLATGGSDFAVMGMHFKLGLYEHQSAGAIQGLIDILSQHPNCLTDLDALKRVSITIYEPAFGIIGDPAKRNPTTRQSADHSMVYIIATLLRKGSEQPRHDWTDLMLMPADYDEAALFDPNTRSIMDRIDFRHGGREFDDRYPDGIPTRIEMETTSGQYDSGVVMYPEGHARNPSGRTTDLVNAKFSRLASLGVRDAEALRQQVSPLMEKTKEDMQSLYDFELDVRSGQDVGSE